MAEKIQPPKLDALQGVENWQLWLSNNVTTLSDKDLATLEAWLADQSPSVMGADFPNKLASAKQGSAERAQKAVESAVAEGERPAEDLNDDGFVSASERSARTELPKRAAESATKMAEQQGATPEQAAAAGSEVGGAIEDLIAGAKPIPPVLQQYVTATNGKPTPEQVSSLIEAWNTLNPLAPVTNEDELYDRLAAGGTSGGPLQKQVIEVGLLGAEPIIDYRIPTIDGDSYTVSAATFELLNREFGYSTAEMTSAVRSAARAGLTDGRGEPAWQVLLGLANATKQRQALTPLTDPSRDPVDQARRELQALIDAARYTGQARDEVASGAELPGIAGAIADMGTEQDGFDEKIAEARRKLDAAIANSNSAGVATASINFTSSTNLQNLAAQFSSARSLYGGDDMLALIQVVDPSLAARVAVTEPGKLSLDDQRKVTEVFLDVGLSPDQMAALGYAWTSNFDGTGTRRGGAGGAEKPQRAMPDPTALRQAATDLYRSLYAADPTEAQIAALTGAVTSAILSAPDNQTIDPNARLRQAAESLPEFDTFYGNRPEGLSTAEYRAQFDQGAASILGTTAADPTTIQGGLRTGKVQTAVGAAAAQKSAWDSSTWMGRLAAAAQQVSEAT